MSTLTPGKKVQRMLERVCGDMGIAPETVELAFYVDDRPTFAEGLSQGTAGTYHEEDGKYYVSIEVGTPKDPLALVATLAHELGHVLLLGHGRISPDIPDHEPLTDLLTVYCGFGVFTANSVIHETHEYDAHFSRWSLGRRGYLSMDLYGYALARFAHARGEENPPWVKHLRPDVRAAFNKAFRFIAATAPEDLAPAPELLDASAERSSDGDAEVEGFAEPASQTESGVRDEVAQDDGEEDGKEERQVLSADELLDCYQRGDREFRELDLQGLQLGGAFLQGCDFTGVDLSEADLTRAVLTECDFSRADLQHAVLCGASLRGSNLRAADLSGANLAHADLSGADIRGTDFREASLMGCILTGTRRNVGTDFTNVDLSESVCEEDLSQEDLQGAMLTDRFNAFTDRIGQWVSYLMCTALAALIGGLVGSVAGWMLQPVIRGGGPDAGGIAGALMFGLISAWKFRSRSDTV